METLHIIGVLRDFVPSVVIVTDVNTPMSGGGEAAPVNTDTPLAVFNFQRLFLPMSLRRQIITLLELVCQKEQSVSTLIFFCSSLFCQYFGSAGHTVVVVEKTFFCHY